MIVHENRRAAGATHHEEVIMNILLWYLPYALFSGACDVMLSESETRADREGPAKFLAHHRQVISALDDVAIARLKGDDDIRE